MKIDQFFGGTVHEVDLQSRFDVKYGKQHDVNYNPGGKESGLAGAVSVGQEGNG